MRAAPRGDRARCANRLDEPVRQRKVRGELGKPLGIERDERLAERLQRVHLSLAARLGRRVVRANVGARFDGHSRRGA